MISEWGIEMASREWRRAAFELLGVLGRTVRQVSRSE
jgi:hypothetical protein